MSMTWSEVFKVHPKIGSLHFGRGHIKSMLFSLDKRRNRHNYKDGTTLFFCFDRSKLSPAIHFITTTLKAGDIFPVYEKISPDCWENIGLHVCFCITDGIDAANRDSLVVTVKPVKS